MHLVLLHGYLLQGTGSNIYVANIAKAWKRQGHAVTVVCQDLQAKALSFVDEYVGPQEPIPKQPPAAGTMRVITPDIAGLLPVYVYDKYDGFEVKTIPQMAAGEIVTHLDLTAAALRQVAEQGADRVLANHAIFGPAIASRALAGTGVEYDVKIHGSAIEYTLVPNPQFMEYALEGLAGARKIFVGTRYVRDRVFEVFQHDRERLDLDEKVEIVPPGMDPEVFAISSDFKATQARFLDKVRQLIAANPNGRQKIAVPKPNGESTSAFHQRLVALADSYDQRATDANLLEKWPEMHEDEPIVLYFGKFLSAKGVGEVLLTVPEILSRVPQARIVFVGFGSYREHMEGMIEAFRDGDLQTFEAFAHAGEFIEANGLDRRFRKLTPAELERVIITGILDHDALREILAMSSVCIVPSKWPEAFGMVAVEAMAAGVLPLCNYHAGLRDVVDEVEAVSPALAEKMKLDREQFAQQMPEKIAAALRLLYPDGFDDRKKRQEVSAQLRQISVEKFSWDGIAQRLVR